MKLGMATRADMPVVVARSTTWPARGAAISASETAISRAITCAPMASSKVIGKRCLMSSTTVWFDRSDVPRSPLAMSLIQFQYRTWTGSSYPCSG